MEVTYPLSPNGVFWTIQGEGQLSGEPTVFVRLAGCNVGCPECDTNYTVDRRVTLDELAREVVAVATKSSKWVWVTGGEPTIHDLKPLTDRLRSLGFKLALATAGTKEVDRGFGVGHGLNGFDFVSVSPHFFDDRWVQRRGEQVNVVIGLNGVRLADVNPADFKDFAYRYLTPCWYHPSDRASSVNECVDWIAENPGWRLNIQAHKIWGLA